MSDDNIEYLLYGGESPKSRFAFERYLAEVKRGKSLLQLQAVAEAITPDIRRSWSARSFTPIQTAERVFDEIVCNISYHFWKHGQKYCSIRRMTDEALRFFHKHRCEAKIRKADGLLVLPGGSLFEPTGKIVTFRG